MNSKFLKTLALLMSAVILITLILSGCSPKDKPEEDSTEITDSSGQVQTLKLPYSRSDKLNPFTAASVLNQSIAELIYDGLFTLDKNYNPVARIASSYTQSGRTLTVMLADAKFSNGASVTGEDVVASFNSAKNSPAYKSRLAVFSSAQVSGRGVVFTLTKDDPYAVNCLTFAITPKGSTEESAAGSGRYIFDNSNGAQRLKAGGTRAGFNPKIKEISLFNVQDVATQKYTLAIGNISFAFDDLRDGEYTRIAASMADVPMNNLVYLTFNRGNAALANGSVRQAIALIIDRADLADTAFQGHAKAAYTPFSPEWGVLSGKDYNQKTDLDAAGKLLDEAGYTSKSGSVRANGSAKLSFKLLVNKDNGFKLHAAQNIKEALEKSNISVTVDALAEKDYRSAVSSGKYDMYIGEMKLTPNMDLSPLLLKGGALTYGVNTDGAASAAYAAMLAGGTDIFAFIDTFNKELPFLPLCYRSGIAAYTRSIAYSGGVNVNDIYADIDTWSFN